MDSWYQRHQGGRFDADGQWANQGQVRTELLQQLLHDDYFSRPAPKSTGREYFNLHWLATQSALSETLAAVDVQATLLELTAQTTIKAAQQYRCEALFVCGGGAHNPCLVQRMRQLAPELEVQSTAVLGLAPDWVEAVLFAWLAWCYRHQQAVPLPSITGGQHSRIIGAHWHA
jgi:anhydro-N-acetylmuramic acid kinase